MKWKGQDRQASTPVERRVLLSVIATTTAGVLPVFLFGGLAVQLRSDLGLSDQSRGLVTFGYFVISALSSIASGRLAERFGPRPTMRAAAIVGAISLVGVAVAQTPTHALIALACGGMANALAQPAANELIVRTIPQRRHGFAFGIKQAAIPVATLLAGLAVPSLGLTIGWRWAFVIAAGFALLACVSVPSPSGHPHVRPSAKAARERFAVLPLVTLALGVGLGSAMANALGAFLTSSAVDAGISAGAAGLLLAFGSALGLAMRVGSGAMADRRPGDHLVRVAAMLGIGAVGLAGLATGIPAMFVVGTALAFGAGWSWPGVFQLAVVNHHPDAPAAATGYTQTGSYTGGAIGPLLMGRLVHAEGYRSAWTVFSLIALAAAAVMVVARSLIRSRVTKAVA